MGMNRSDLVEKTVAEIRQSYEELGWEFELVTQLFTPTALILEYTVTIVEGTESMVESYVYVKALKSDRLRQTTIKTYQQWRNSDEE